MNPSRPMQRKTWIVSYPISCPDICTSIRETCAELLIDEIFSTSEDGRRYVLFHVDIKLRTVIIERALNICGVADCNIQGLDSSPLSSQWLSIITRHCAADDARLSAWVKPGKTRSLVTFDHGARAAVSRVREDSAVVASAVETTRAKRPRGDGGEDTRGADLSQLSRVQELLVERDRQLVEKDTRYDIALADMRTQQQRLFDERDVEVRKMLAQCEQADKRAADAESKLRSVLAELRLTGGDVSEREVLLVCDLKAEKRNVVFLTAQLKVTGEKLQRETDNSACIQIKCNARVQKLEMDLRGIRAEARRWECDGERKTNAMNICMGKLNLANLTIEKLQSECYAKDEIIVKLRDSALGVIKDEMDFVCDTRVAQVKSLAALDTKEQLEIIEKYKTRNTALNRALGIARAQLKCFGAGIQ